MSEGRRADVIARLAEAAGAAKGARLLDVSLDADHKARRRGIGAAAGELIGRVPRDALPPDPVVSLHLRAFHARQVLDLERVAIELDTAPS